ncbi:MAG: hypothetical protein SFW65_10170 [Alphaproteobacteria bacterium]|nr:hypothetical protein [Alphaproteobacteria bacterium]
MAPPCIAEEQSAIQVAPEVFTQNSDSWQNIKAFDDTALFAVAGPPTAEDAAKAKADTELYEAMVDNFDNLEDEDDEYLFVIEALFDPEDSSRPASLRMDDDVDDEVVESITSPNLNSSIYIDTVRPTFFPGFQIKPRELDPDKKDNTDARSLFADLNKPKADDILKDDTKPIISGPPQPQTAVPTLPASTKETTESKLEKAGKINAPPKQRPLSPDEETLGALKQAVKELGLENKLNLGKSVGGHEALENNEDHPQDKLPQGTAPDVAKQKQTPITTKQRAFMNKKARKAKQPRRRVKPVEQVVPEEPPPPPKETGSFLDDLF